MNPSRLCFVFVFLLYGTTFVSAQNVSFEAVSSPDTHFDFRTVAQYQNGIVQYNALQLSVQSDARWDFFVGTETDVPGLWNQTVSYGSHGDLPTVELLQLRVRSGAGTPHESGFFALRDISTPVYLIGSEASDVEITCGSGATNAPGSYLTEPTCYTFNVDMRLQPGFGWQPGAYALTIHFVLVPDL